MAKSDISTVVRILELGEHEFSSKNVAVSGETPTLFTSGLAEGYKRLGCILFNNSNASSGQCFVGPATVTIKNGYPVAVGSALEIPLDEDTDFYMCAGANKLLDIRVMEYA
jgi:hypothetical protein